MGLGSRLYVVLERSGFFGGSAAGCIGQGGFESACALNGVWIAPLMLFAAGVVAGLVTASQLGANADSPEQDADYQRMRAMLEPLDAPVFVVAVAVSSIALLAIGESPATAA